MPRTVAHDPSLPRHVRRGQPSGALPLLRTNRRQPSTLAPRGVFLRGLRAASGRLAGPALVLARLRRERALRGAVAPNGEWAPA